MTWVQQSNSHRTLIYNEQQLVVQAVKTIFKYSYRFLLKCIPENRLGDHFFSIITFFRMHRRFPTDKPLFNDVLYKIKTTDEILDPIRVFVSDKELVKLFVKAIAGDRHNVPTIRVLHSLEEVNNYQFPADCCIKPTHLSGKVLLRRDNRPIDFEEIQRWFNSSFYHVNREANYKTLKPKVIVEPLIFDSDNLSDYKIFCYQGKPKLIQVDVDRQLDHTRKIFDLDWNEMPFSLGYPLSQRQIEKPKNLDNMLGVAASLASYFNFVRVDLYSNGEECYVGEITNCHGNAGENFIPKTGELAASNMIFGN
jgi:hypothetical protein